MIDRLESRRLLDAFIEPDGTLVVQGTALDDQIVVQESADRRFADITITGGEVLQTSFLTPFADPQNGFTSIRVIGDNGNDIIQVVGNVPGGFGVNVQIYADDGPTGGDGSANDGNDTVIGGASGEPTLPNVARVLSTIIGGEGNDFIQSFDGFDFIDAEEGNDTVFGGAGDDTIFGGTGNDQISGDTGNDQIFGNAGNDTLNGDDDNDTITGGTGADVMTGGLGFDFISYADRGGNQRIWVTYDNVANEGLFNVQNNVMTSTENDAMGVGDTWEGVIGGGANDILDSTQTAESLWLIGGGGEDSILGNDIGDDTLDGGDGNDTIRGAGGNDSILGGAGNDNLFGDAGEDVIFGDWNAAENPLFVGIFGNDALSGGPDNDTLDGELGDDRMQGLGGNDFFVGGADAIITDIETIYSGADTIDGGVGIDTVDYSMRTRPVRINFDGGPDDGDPDTRLNLGLGESDFVNGSTEVVIGTELNDTMVAQSGGTVFSHWFMGNGGNDSLVTADGPDTLEGGEGNDTMNAGLGADVVDGGVGTDSFLYTGRTGDITVIFDDLPGDGEPGEVDDLRSVEHLTTGSGHDLVDASDAASAVTVIALSGNDTLRGSAFNDSLDGGIGSNSLFGQGGHDTMAAGNGADEFFGGDGFDFVDYSTATATVMVTFDDVANDGTVGEGDNVHSDVEGFQGGAGGNLIDISDSSAGRKIVGGTGNDTLIGSAFNDTLEGGDGADVIRGGDGNDYLVGGNGDDSLEGGNGNDRLLGGIGRDTLDGGEGNDTLIGAGGSDVLIGGNGRDMASWYYERRSVIASIDGKPNDGVAGENDDVRSDVENFQGGMGNDTMTGNSGRNAMDGGPGNDVLIGMNGKDTLYGNTGSDTLNGGTHDDWLIGFAGPDRLIGGNGLDTGDYSAYTVAVFLSLDNLANDGSFNEFDKIDRDVEILLGGSGSDSIVGGVLAETLNGGPGNDTLRGGVLNDCLIGGTGFDQLFGEDGDDTLVGNDGQVDTLSPGIGNDSLLQDVGLDIIQ